MHHYVRSGVLVILVFKILVGIINKITCQLHQPKQESH
jgi:hypothetical protein